MDRTMYGKVDLGTYQPYRCARKQLPSPGCKCPFACYIHFSCKIK